MTEKVLVRIELNHLGENIKSRIIHIVSMNRQKSDFLSDKNLLKIVVIAISAGITAIIYNMLITILQSFLVDDSLEKLFEPILNAKMEFAVMAAGITMFSVGKVLKDDKEKTRIMLETLEKHPWSFVIGYSMTMIILSGLATLSAASTNVIALALFLLIINLLKGISHVSPNTERSALLTLTAKLLMKSLEIAEIVVVSLFILLLGIILLLQFKSGALLISLFGGGLIILALSSLILNISPKVITKIKESI